MNKTTEWKYLFLILIIFIAACIETDIYLPAFADMMVAFAATEGSIQNLLTWNFFGICLAGPLYGPLSDSYGRKRPLLIALGIFLLGSVLTLIAQNLDQMLWGRILQGLGSGGCFTLGTAILFDAFEKRKAIDALNVLNTLIPLVMAAAPLIGGYLNNAYGFRSNFLTIALFVAVSFFISFFFFSETLPVEKRKPLRTKDVANDFKQALCCLPLWQLTMTISLLFGGYIAFLSGSSLLFVVEFQVSKAIFPYFQAAILGAWVAASLFLRRAIDKWGVLQIKRAGIFLVAFGALCLTVTSFIAGRDPWLLTMGILFYAFGANWIIGLYFPESMEILPHIKGVVASLLTSVRLLMGALVVGLAGALYNATIFPLLAVILGSVVLMLPLLLLYERKKKIAQNRQEI